MRRVQRAIDKEEVIKTLTSADRGVFREIWRLMIFAAFLGHRLGRRDALGEVESGKSIDESVFANSPAWPGILYLLALVESDSPAVLSGTEEAADSRLVLFEEYANGGLGYLEEQLESQSYSLDSLASLIVDYVIPEAGRTVPLADISI